MSLLSIFKKIFTRKNHVNLYSNDTSHNSKIQTVNSDTVFNKHSNPSSIKESSKKNFSTIQIEQTPLNNRTLNKDKSNTLPLKHSKSPLFDTQAIQTELNTLLSLPNGSEKDTQLIEFANKSPSADYRWQAIQATSPAAWQMVLKQMGSRDKRIYKWVKNKIAKQQAEETQKKLWDTLSIRYQHLLLKPNIELSQWIEIDKAFDNAHIKYPFDQPIQATVNEWRVTLQHRLQVHNGIQRNAQHILAELHTIYTAIESKQYHPELNTRLNAIKTKHQDLPAIDESSTLNRLYTEINQLLSTVNDALTAARIQEEQLIQANQLLDKAQLLSQKKPSDIHAEDISGLKQAWHDELNTFTPQKQAFNMALNRLNHLLHTQHSQNNSVNNTLINKINTKHSKSLTSIHTDRLPDINWIISKKSALANALETGQGYVAMALYNEINHYLNECTQTDLPSEQGIELNQLLSEARKIRSILWYQADLEREAIIVKLNNLAQKPLIGKFQTLAFKEATDAWKAINTKIGPASIHLYTQFKAASDAAYIPIKTYKDNMEQIHRAGSEQRNILLKELESLKIDIDWNTVNWYGLNTMCKQARKQWKDSLPAAYKDRALLEERFNAIMQVFETQLNNARHTELIRREELTQMVHNLNGQAFATQHAKACELMKRYTNERIAVPIAHAINQTTWNTFRTAIDAIYTQRDTERQLETEQNVQLINDLIQAKQTILAQLNTFYTEISAVLEPIKIDQNKSNNTTFIHLNIDSNALNIKLDTIAKQWTELGDITPSMGAIIKRDLNPMIKDWETVYAAIHTAIKQLNGYTKHRRINQALDLATAINQLHSHSSETDTLNVLNLWNTACIDPVIKQAFADRIDRIQNKTNTMVNQNTTDHNESNTQLNKAILAAEIANQIDSPSAYKLDRLALQVQYLSNRLTGVKHNYYETGLTTWLTALALPNSTFAEAKERIARITNHLLSNNPGE